MHTGEGAARLRHVAEALLGNHHARLAVLLQVPARPTSVYACTYQLACQSEDAFLQSGWEHLQGFRKRAYGSITLSPIGFRVTDDVGFEHAKGTRSKRRTSPEPAQTIGTFPDRIPNPSRKAQNRMSRFKAKPRAHGSDQIL